jgi:hypothetical protein
MREQDVLQTITSLKARKRLRFVIDYEVDVELCDIATIMTELRSYGKAAITSFEVLEGGVPQTN